MEVSDEEVKAEYEEETEVEIDSATVDDEQQQMYVMPAEDVTTWVQFLGVSDSKFVAGEEVTALIGMHNAGEKTYNVSYSTSIDATQQCLSVCVSLVMALCLSAADSLAALSLLPLSVRLLSLQSVRTSTPPTISLSTFRISPFVTHLPCCLLILK